MTALAGAITAILGNGKSVSISCFGITGWPQTGLEYMGYGIIYMGKNILVLNRLNCSSLRYVDGIDWAHLQSSDQYSGVSDKIFFIYP